MYANFFAHMPRKDGFLLLSMKVFPRGTIDIISTLYVIGMGHCLSSQSSSTAAGSVALWPDHWEIMIDAQSELCPRSRD